MTWLQVINALVVAIGIPTIVKVLMDMGARLKTLDILEKDIRDTIKPDLKDVRERFFALEGKTSALFQGGSPVQLMTKGERALEESGLKKYIDDNKDFLILECDAKKETTAYEVQEHIFKLFDKLTFSEEFDKKLKEYAFEHAITTSILRRIGAIYFRDICLEKFKMKAEDIDKHEQKK